MYFLGHLNIKEVELLMTEQNVTSFCKFICMSLFSVWESMMKGSYKTPPDTKEPLDYGYIAANGKILDSSEYKFLIKST
jgi:hypothetical protein